MDALITLSSSVIGIVGVFAGAIFNEFLRRNRRVEDYSSDIFKRRLDAYEALMNLIVDGSSIANEVIENPALTYEERHARVSLAIEPIAKHVDSHALYIDEYLGSHCVALFMGIEDIPETSEPKKSQLLQKYYHGRKEAQRMIAEDSGIARINGLFQSINRPRITGPVIERIKELRHERQKAKKETA